jgi:hypothetical protein
LGYDKDIRTDVEVYTTVFQSSKEVSQGLLSSSSHIGMSQEWCHDGKKITQENIVVEQHFGNPHNPDDLIKNVLIVFSLVFDHVYDTKQ